MSQNFRARGSTREWGQWVILIESVEGRGLGQELRAHSVRFWGPRVPGASWGPTNSLAQVARMELALQANRMPEKRLGHQRSPRQAHRHLPEGVAQRPALIRISKFQAHVAPGALGGFARPGPLRTIPGLLEHGHPVPGSHWPPLLPIRGDRSKVALWDRVSG